MVLIQFTDVITFLMKERLLRHHSTRVIMRRPVVWKIITPCARNAVGARK